MFRDFCCNDSIDSKLCLLAALNGSMWSMGTSIWEVCDALYTCCVACAKYSLGVCGSAVLLLCVHAVCVLQLRTACANGLEGGGGGCDCALVCVFTACAHECVCGCESTW